MNIVEDTNNWIGWEVITETGIGLGWVSHVIADCEENSPSSLTISLLPSLWLPKAITGCYKLSADEIVSTGPERIIVAEQTEYRLMGLTISWLERLGLVKPPWRQEYEDIPSAIIEGWNNDDGGAAASPVPAPRKPGPNPLNAEAKIPKE